MDRFAQYAAAEGGDGRHLQMSAFRAALLSLLADVAAPTAAQAQPADLPRPPPPAARDEWTGGHLHGASAGPQVTNAVAATAARPAMPVPFARPSPRHCRPQPVS